ncbi:MAG: transglycosylase domain-containing protein, partial [Clostridia bacterium]|nr:transglycosylase domain-containing protein [Clostridia bacterium]
MNENDTQHDTATCRRRECDAMRKNTKETNEKQNTKKIKKQSPKRILVICLAVFVLLGSVLAGSMWGFTDNITDQIAQEKNLDFSSIVYYIDEETKQPVEYDRLYAEQNRIWVDLENTPEMLKKAFIAIEDERFLKHHGIDLKRTLGATIGFIFKGSDSYGGSTITQQLIKNITGDNKRGPIRKVREMFRAINLEQKMSKDDIIELYMNTIYLGQGVHGVQAASNVYFSKDVSQLTLAECASIAGITQYPSRYDPLLNYEAHKEKQELVLGKMLELEYITQEEHDAAVKEELKLVKGTAKTSGIKIQSYYIDQIVS